MLLNLKIKKGPLSIKGIFSVKSDFLGVLTFGKLYSSIRRILKFIDFDYAKIGKAERCGNSMKW
jgi:hypothetical protein